MDDIRNDFPILVKKMNDQPLIYFDNAATTHKPQAVIDAIINFYLQSNANVGRSVYSLGEQATKAYERSRQIVARSINASDPSEIVFTRGATDGINSIASTWASDHVNAGDEIMVRELEHHSNLLPWQRLAQQKRAQLRIIPVFCDGTLDMEWFAQTLNPNTKLVAITHVSNALGTTVDMQTIIKSAHAAGAKVLVDAAQSVPHRIVDVQLLEADFLVFSGHKMLAPTGIGVLYINKSLHPDISPYQLGGGMVYEANFGSATFLPMPHRLEAGTPPIAQAIGLAAAIEYLQKNINVDDLKKHEAQLCAQLINGLQQFDRVKILGPIDQLKKQGHLVSFVIDGIHAHDVAAYLDQYGIAVRAGHHCAQPLAKKLGIESSVRASFYCYNTAAEVDRFVQVMKKLLCVM